MNSNFRGGRVLRGGWRVRVGGRGSGMHRPSRGGGSQNSGGRLTHFLALPLGHHPALRSSVRNFLDALLQHTPPIPGLNPSITIDPRRMHLTLGVMSLSTADERNPGTKTLEEALALLESVRPMVGEILSGHKLLVSLDVMDVMNPLGDLDKANVLWLGPCFAADDARRLRSVCDYIHQTFKDHGFVVEDRPLKLHCTIINTSYAKPRIPFSYSAMLSSRAVHDVLSNADVTGSQRVVNFGIWQVDEVQICRMGSHGPENEYVSCGSIALP